MSYASKTPRDLNHDPEPFRDERGSRWTLPVTFQDHSFTFDPRPEFDHVQHNEPNPILVDIRAWAKGVPAKHMLKAIDRAWRGAGHYVTKGWVRITSEDQIEHARRVLTRLAAFESEQKENER